MILVYVGIIILALAWWSGRLHAVAEYKFKGGGWAALLLVGSFFLQSVVVVYTPHESRLVQVVVFVSSQIIVIGLMVLNRHLPGLRLAAVGVTFNLLVVVANGGFMPIPLETYESVYPHRPPIEAESRPPNSKNITLTWDNINLVWLADIIPTPWLWRWYVVSVGDVVMMVGASFFLFAGRRKKQEILEAI